MNLRKKGIGFPFFIRLIALWHRFVDFKVYCTGFAQNAKQPVAQSVPRGWTCTRNFCVRYSIKRWPPVLFIKVFIQLIFCIGKIGRPWYALDPDLQQKTKCESTLERPIGIKQKHVLVYIAVTSTRYATSELPNDLRYNLAGVNRLNELV